MYRSSVIFLLALACFLEVRSASGLNFSAVDIKLATPLKASFGTKGGSQFVVVGTNNIVLVSQGNLKTWATNAIAFPTPGIHLISLAYGENRFVAGANNGSVFSSTDGAEWVSRGNAIVGGDPVGGLAYSAGSNGTFLAISLGASQIRYTDINLSTWRLANVNSSLFEIYQAVTPFGSNGFAACGTLGVVRISTDAGRNWRLAGNRPSAALQNALLGIAASQDTLVCVGTRGTIIFSTNGGVTWGYTNLVGTTNLNAVAHGTSGFLAVGDRGALVESTDGVKWRQRVSPTTNNLYGVRFTGDGSEADVAVLVGNRGQIVIAGPIPADLTPQPDKTTCAGGESPVLSVSVDLPDTADWYGDVTLTNLLAPGVSTYTPPQNDVANAGTNIYWVRARDTRTDFVSSNALPMKVVVMPRPKATVSGSGAICFGDSTEITAELEGTGPWTVAWSDSTTNRNVTTKVLTRSVAPTASTVYRVVALTDALCSTTELTDLKGEASVVVNNRPTSSVIGTNTICLGDAIEIQADLGGTGPWTVVWSDGTTNANVTGTRLTRSVAPTNDTTFSIISLTDSLCSTTDPLYLRGNASIKVNLRPTAVVTGTNTICKGDPVEIHADLGGTGPWTVIWSDGTTNANVTGTRLTRSVAPTNDTTFSIISLTDSLCSTADPLYLRGNASIKVNLRPTAVVTGTNTICNGDLIEISADLGGTGPWTVIWSDGTTNANVSVTRLTRSVAPTNDTTFSIISLTDSLCSTTQAVDLRGRAQIKVTDRPTAVVSGSTNVFLGTNATIQVSLTGKAPWRLEWSDGEVTEASTNLVTRTVAPSRTTDYRLLALKDANGCNADPARGELSGSALVTIVPILSVGIVDGAKIKIAWIGGAGCTLMVGKAVGSNGTITWEDSSVLATSTGEIIEDTSESAKFYRLQCP